MTKKQTTILLSFILAVLLIGMGVLIWALLRDCNHASCEMTTYEANCQDKGYTHYRCRLCGYQFDADYIAPLGHNFTDRVVSATCESEGYNAHYCSVCGIEDKDNYVRPLGHNFVESVTEPKCEEQGFTYAKCTRCDFDKKYDFTKPTEHDFVATKKNPLNIGDTGYTTYTCKVCDREYIGDYKYYTDIFSGAEGTGEGALAFGVDIYKWSNDVNFAKLKSDGVDFVILRVGFDDTLDVNFETYYRQAKAVGLDVGVFFFTLAESKADALADAERVLKWIEGKQFEYPIFYDIEDYKDYKPSEFSEGQIMEIAHTFMTEMVKANYYPGLYTNNKLLYNVFNDEKTLRLYDVWYARYPSDNHEDFIDEYSSLYSMWQYAGSVEGFSGISGTCDLNYAFKDYPTIIKKNKFNGFD